MNFQSSCMDHIQCSSCFTLSKWCKKIENTWMSYTDHQEIHWVFFIITLYSGRNKIQLGVDICNGKDGGKNGSIAESIKCVWGSSWLTKKYLFSLKPKAEFHFHVLKTFCPISILKKTVCFFSPHKNISLLKALPNEIFLPFKQFFYPSLRKTQCWAGLRCRNICNNSEMCSLDSLESAACSTRQTH